MSIMAFAREVINPYVLFNYALGKHAADLSDNEAGVSQSNLIRYKKAYCRNTAAGSILSVPSLVYACPRDACLARACKRQDLAIARSRTWFHYSCSASDIMPQTNTTNPTPSFSVRLVAMSLQLSMLAAVCRLSMSCTSTLRCLSVRSLTGAYKVNSVGGSSTYTILAQYGHVTASSSGVVPLFTTSSGSAIINVVLPDNGINRFLDVRAIIAPTSSAATIQDIPNLVCYR